MGTISVSLSRTMSHHSFAMDLVKEQLATPYSPLIHVGYSKALSTWLQRHLFKPVHGFTTVLEAVGLYRSIILQPEMDFDVTPVRKALNGYYRKWGPVTRRTPVITHEGLVGMAPAGGYNAKLNADRLATCFDSARILIVVREQRAMLRSLYSELVRQQAYPHSVGYMVDPIRPPRVPCFSPDFLRYDRLVAYYQHLFSSENVLVLPMERFIEAPEDFTETIVAFAGRRRKARRSPPYHNRPNTKSGLAALHLARMLNRHLFRTGLDDHGLVRDPQRIARIRRRTLRRC